MVQKLGEAGGRGYDPDLLGLEVATPVPRERILGELLVWEDGTILPHTQFSLTMSLVALRLLGALAPEAGTQYPMLPILCRSSSSSL